ncbi:hypothetical protein [Acinetobacter radioresistens]|uniref:hypothetical protein n=1 Tax=Acinetobacter radioresistens TaxID=40216 RepID=UPI003212DD4F
MFIRHNDYMINTDQINFMRINNEDFSVFISFGVKPEGSATGASLKIEFEDDLDLGDFLEKFE